jgi:hypothetical protein
MVFLLVAGLGQVPGATRTPIAAGDSMDESCARESSGFKRYNEL